MSDDVERGDDASENPTGGEAASDEAEKNRLRGRRASDRRRDRVGAELSAEEDPTIARAFGDDTRRRLARPQDETRLHAPVSPRKDTGREGAADASLSGALSQLAPSDLDKTVVLPAEPKVKRPGARLLLIKGLTAGAQLDIPKSPFLVGRSQNADLTLLHPALSLAHFVLWFDDVEQVWTLEDLQSTSGTLVNGRIADEEVELHPGDVIAAGRLEFRFFAIDLMPVVTPDAETQVTRITRIARGEDVIAEERRIASGKRLRKRLALFAALLTTLLVVAGIVGSVYFATRDPAKATARNREADGLVIKAVAALDRLDLAGARNLVEAALALSASHQNAQSVLRMVESEEAAQRSLDAAQKALGDDDPEGAERALRKIANTSRFVKKRDQMRVRIHRAALQLELGRIQALLTAGDARSARDLLDDVAARYPDAGAMLAPLRDRLAKLVREQKLPPKAVRRAQQAFNVGNLTQARLLAKSSANAGEAASTSFLRRLNAFESAFAQGKKALLKKQGAPASRLLEEARALSVALSGGKRGGMTRKVSAPLADALYLVASSDLGRDRRCAGASKLLRGRRLAPGSKAIAKKLKELEYEAERALVRAQASTSPARKRQLAQSALCLVSKRSRLYRELKALAQ